jgi:hypothetical protein
VCANFLEKKIFENFGYFFWPGARGVWPDIEKFRIIPDMTPMPSCRGELVEALCKKSKKFNEFFSRKYFLTEKPEKCPVLA